MSLNTIPSESYNRNENIRYQLNNVINDQTILFQKITEFFNDNTIENVSDRAFCYIPNVIQKLGFRPRQSLGVRRS